MSNSRLEKFIYAICGMEVDDLPTPLSRIEMLWNCLITGETPDFEPLSRNEKYLMSMLTGDVDALPEPTSRSEKLLYKIATGETDLSDVPGYLSRYEELLKQLIENGGIGGTDFEYILYTLNDGFSTLYSTAEVPVRSAILKGQTLVNLATPIEFKSITYHGYCLIINGGMLKSGTYTLKSSVDFSQYVVNLMSTQKDKPSQYRRISIAKNGVFTIDDTFFVANGVTTEDFFICLRPVDNPSGGTVTTNEIENAEFILLEGDYTNTDIPYFEGMQSVKMPVLTTTGKNLFDTNTVPRMGSEYNDFTKAYATTIKPILNLKPNTTYQINGEITQMPNRNSVFKFVDNNGVEIQGTYVSMNNINGSEPKKIKVNNKFTTGNNGEIYFNTFPAYTQEDLDKLKDILNSSKIQIEEGVQATPYEPYKSNILSCNEEVTLRGIGEVKDTLDGNTGELTQRIGEVFSNSLRTSSALSTGTYANVIFIDYPVNFLGWDDTNLICDKLKIIKRADINWGKTSSINGISLSPSGFWFIVDKTITTQEQANEYLNNLNATIQYELPTTIIKTVDLSILDQDGQPTKLKTFNDITHVSIEAEDLLPTIDLEVATKIEETLSSLPTQMIDILEKQQSLNEKIDDQAEDINEVSTAITEIHNDIL